MLYNHTLSHQRNRADLLQSALSKNSIFCQQKISFALTSCAIAALLECTPSHKFASVIDQHAGFVVIFSALRALGADKAVLAACLEQLVACGLLRRAIELVLDRVAQRLDVGDWEIFESSSKALTEGSTTLEKDDFIFERTIDGVPVNYVRETSLPVNEQALEWENEDGTLHEGQSEGWENEVLTMDFCSGTLQSFLHRNPIEASNASDERLFLLPFDEVKDIFEKTITLQVMTEDKNRLISVDGGSHYRYPSIDAQSAEITITKVQLGYMCMPDSEGSDTEAVLIPVWDFYGTWTSEEPEYEYGNGEDGLVMGDVTMDDAGVPLLTIDARDGSVIQRIQAGWAVSAGDN